MTIMKKPNAFLLICFFAGCTGELSSDDESLDLKIDVSSDQKHSTPDIGPDFRKASDLGKERDFSGDVGPDLIVDPCVALNCKESEICDLVGQLCICREGYVDAGEDCVLAAPGDPATRTKADMCTQWTAALANPAALPWETDGLECGPGAMPRAAIDDTIRRINAYRWLSGLSNVTDNPDAHRAQMECAAMMSKQGALSHTPGPDYACYTEAGAGAAGRSNIAYGYRSSAAAIEGYMDDGGVPNLGHRRWILNAPLGRVGIGFSNSGSRPGQCLSVFDRSGTGTRDWTSFPNHGQTPLANARYIWSFQYYGGAIGQETSATVVRVSGNMEMPVITEVLGGGGLPGTLKITRDNWDVEVGQTYRVTITNLNGGDLTYEISPVTC